MLSKNSSASMHAAIILVYPSSYIPAVHAVEDHEVESLYEGRSKSLVNVYLHDWCKGVDRCRNQEGSNFFPNIPGSLCFLSALNFARSIDEPKIDIYEMT